MGKSASEATDLWAQNMGSATNKIRAGVNAVSTSPGQQAVAKVDQWQQAVSSQRARDKYVKRLGAMSTDAWKQSMLGKGLTNMQAGIASAKPKVLRHLSAFIPHVQSVAQTVRAMPSGNLEANIARMVAQVRGNASFVSS